MAKIEIGALRERARKSAEGKWFDYQGIRLLIAPSNNPKFLNFLSKKGESFVGGNTRGRKRRKGPKMTDLVKEGIARFIWLGFEDLQHDGKDIENTPENRLQILNDPDIGAMFREDIFEIADEMAADVEDEREETAGNS